jgi:hypothetical protein
MKIYVSEEFGQLKQQLEQKGYEIVLDKKYLNYCDVVICDLKNGGLAKFQDDKTVKKEGMLIIDIGSKTAEDIEHLLNNRILTYLI